MTIKKTVKRSVFSLLGGFAVILAAGCGRATSSPAAGPEPEAVQIGYGTIEKKNVTGSVASLTAEEIGQARVGRVEELFEGRVAGVQVIRQANGQISLRIRGTNSLLGNNEPLVVIDGMPVQTFGVTSALAGIAPSDVQRIDVLKDAGSTAIYGSRGANGVIVVTTKRAR